MIRLCAVVALALTLGGCESPKESDHPNIEYKGVGTVMSMDWGQRSFVLREDNGLTLTIKSCHGEMPIWLRERVRIHTHRSWLVGGWDRYEGCDHLDWVQQMGADAK